MYLSLRISNKYGSLTRNKVLMKSSIKNNMTYIQNTLRFWGFKLTFADWLKFSLIVEYTDKIDVWFQVKFLTNDALDPRSYMLGWVIVSRQLHFHVYYLFVDLSYI
jgi:hypothetical protein